MIEKIVLDYLNSKMSVPAYMEKPQNPPTEYILIEKTGGSESQHIRRATIAIQSYSDTLYNASCLNEDVISAMDAITELSSVSRCVLNSDYNFTDTSKKQHRYQAVFDVIYF